VAEIEKTVAVTANNSGLHLTFALNYGSRQEITNACKQIADKVRMGDINLADIDQNMISEHLQTATVPDPDLIVRTSGEKRLSNFLMWQAAYSEIHITDVMWPDFTVEDLHKALRDFAGRERRFGAVGARAVDTHA
jgi:undecaprenyl diphosphate synthase